MPRDRRFTFALALSLLLHLSAVTVFSIVITFPRQRPDTMALALMSPELWSRRFSLDLGASPGPAADTDLGLANLRLSGDITAPDQPPAVTLPTLRFAELERMRVREQRESLQTRYGDTLGAQRTTDSWARFGEELGSLGAALSRLTLSWGGSGDGRDRPIPAGRPAAGFEAYVEWLSEPRDRELIYSPPIETLLTVDPTTLTKPVAVVFAVNNSGRVVEIMPPLEDDGGIVRGIVRALWQYRFEPVPGGEASRDIQRGTLLVARAEGGGRP